MVSISSPFQGWTFVLSTNISETSLTIPEVNTVIDTGTEKIMYEDDEGQKQLHLQWISKVINIFIDVNFFHV